MWLELWCLQDSLITCTKLALDECYLQEAGSPRLVLLQAPSFCRSFVFSLHVRFMPLN